MDGGMLLQPGGTYFDRAVWEEVNGQTRLQVTDQGSIAQSALAGPVIETNNVWL